MHSFVRLLSPAPQRAATLHLTLPIPADMLSTITEGVVVSVVDVCRRRFRYSRPWLLLCALALPPLCALSEPTSPDTSKTRHTVTRNDEKDEEPVPQKWFLLLGGANAHPRLESERLIRDYFDPIMNNLAPGHGDARTVGDLRDRYLLWTPFLAVGRNLNDHWSIFLQAGYAAGKVRTKETTPSIVLLPLHTDFEIKRGAFYTGTGVDYFPWGMPERAEYDSLSDRLRAARPYIGVRATYTYATYEAKVKVGFKPFPNLVSLNLQDAWGIPSYGAVVGVDVPLTKKSALSANAAYNWFTDEERDFNGPAFTVVWKHFFR